jgi:L-2-hydroxyglutarate oxidase LhgO
METIDTAVIGGGVIGLAAALAVARRGHSVCVLEKEPRPGMGTSTHNSQVVHAGIYYPANTLKTRHCVAGNPMLYAFCEEHGVPYKRTGKLIVAATEHEIPTLEQLLAKGAVNGVPGLTMVDQQFIRDREPNIRAVAAIWSPTTGIVEAEALIRTLARLCAEHDAFVLTGTPLTAADARADGIELRTSAETIFARSVINAAGLFADEVSAQLGGQPFTIYPCRGEYAELTLSKRSLVNGLVYPVPHAQGHGLGVHLTKTVAGSVSLGPTVCFQDSREDYESRRIPIEDFLEPARELLPMLELEDLRLGGSGIRPKLHPPSGTFADFMIERDSRNPRLVQASGIESPGLTACLSIAEQVAGLVDDVLQ